MNLDLLLDMLGIDSTSGSEKHLIEFLKRKLTDGSCPFMGDGFEITVQKAGGDSENILLDWSGTGAPEYVFCTHLDTVPPYIRPTVSKDEGGTVICGRGSCDAKGQIFTMLNAAAGLAMEGYRDIGVLLVYGEETGSFGARAWDRGGRFVMVGEPTDNQLISASKGTKHFQVTLHGKACHSGYPENGLSAVDLFVDFVNRLRTVDFPDDPLLGSTTWNIGRLNSDNPQNILSPLLSFRIYFRTTFASDGLIESKLRGICPTGADIEAFGGDDPLEYFHAVPGIQSKISCFGSDAPRLKGYAAKAIFGPGSILTAHTDNEYVRESDLEKAVAMETEIMKYAIDNKI